MVKVANATKNVLAVASDQSCSLLLQELETILTHCATPRTLIVLLRILAPALKLSLGFGAVCGGPLHHDVGRQALDVSPINGR